MYSLDELFVMNRALDGHDIREIPSFDELRDDPAMALKLIDIKKSLIEKGILMTPDEFTDYGIRTVSRLKKYKEAKKYVAFQHIIFAIENSETGVVLKKSESDESWDFEPFTVKDVLDYIFETYSFLREGNVRQIESVDSEIAPDEMFRMYFLESEAGFRLFTHSSTADSQELFFCKNDVNYIYDLVSDQLKSFSNCPLESFMLERFSVEEVN